MAGAEARILSMHYAALKRRSSTVLRGIAELRNGTYSRNALWNSSRVAESLKPEGRRVLPSKR
jgi:hypothetical protein